MDPGIRVNQRALPAAVPAIRAAVSRFLDPYHLPSPQIEDIRLAVSEACGNVVRHAYPDGSGDVRCELAVTADEVVIWVSDWGCGVDSPSDQPGLGLGAELMAMAADSVLTSRSEGKTVVTLRFRLPIPG